MKRVLIALVIIVVVVFAALLWMAGGPQSTRTFEDPVTKLDVKPAKLETDTATVVTVLSWNVAWGRGFGSEGTGSAKPKEFFDASIPRIGAVIRTLEADIVLMQEVDFGATRSHGVDQAREIATAAGLPYVAYAVSWEANWIPFPYWPPSEHFGRMKSGGAILSRFPITKNTVQLLDKPAAYAWWYNLFYLFRYVQTCEIDVGGKKLQVLNTHLEAFDGANREAQATLINHELSKKVTPLTMFGGDFNTVPPESTVMSGYPDEVKGTKTNHENENTLSILRSIPNLADVIPGETFRKEQEPYFTFPAHAPNRKLDYLFIGTGFDIVEVRVAREAGDVSDHLPLLAKLGIH